MHLLCNVLQVLHALSLILILEMKIEMYEAVERGDIESVTRLLDNGVDINRGYYGVCVVSSNVCIGC